MLNVQRFSQRSVSATRHAVICQWFCFALTLLAACDDQQAVMPATSAGAQWAFADAGVADDADAGDVFTFDSASLDDLGGLADAGKPPAEVEQPTSGDVDAGDLALADLPTTCPPVEPPENGPCAVPAGKMCGFHPDCCCFKGNFTCLAVEEYWCKAGKWLHVANDTCFMAAADACTDSWLGDSDGSGVDTDSYGAAEASMAPDIDTNATLDAADADAGPDLAADASAVTDSFASADAPTPTACTCASDGNPCTADFCDLADACTHVACANLPNVATATCGTACSIGACKPGFANCNGELTDGCETIVDPNVKGCGPCGTICPSVAHGAGACLSDACTITSCESGFADCNGNPMDGCETDLGTSAQNCGGCGKACQLPFADFVGCGGGQCQVLACVAGHVNCDGKSSNGCEALPGACDSSPPAPITTLAAEEGLQVHLTWQAVGEDGNIGTATRYIVKYATTPITDDDDFAAAKEFKQNVSPKPAGEKDELQVQGLKPRATYYFVVRAVDKDGNLGLFTDDASAKAGSFGLAWGGQTYWTMQWEDFDGDGDLDLSNSYKAYRNDGNLIFTAVDNSAEATLEFDDGSMADIDNDGDLDHIDFAIYKEVGHIRRNDGHDDKGVPIWTTIWETPGSGELLAGSWLDYNRDGKIDLVGLVKNPYGTDSGVVLYGSASGGVFEIVGMVAGESIYKDGISAADLNSDGQHDVVWTRASYAQTVVLDVATWPGAKIVWTSSDKAGQGSAACGDFDNDGDFDVIEDGYFAWPDPYPPVLYSNNGKNQFTVALPATAIPNGGEWGDFDNDGDLDLATGTEVYRSYEADFYGKNVPPSPPKSGLTAKFDPATRVLIMQFPPGQDSDPDGPGPLGATPSAGLYYEIAVGTSPGVNDVISPVYGSPLLGHHGQMWLNPTQHGFALHDPPAGKLYWKVRAIDAGLAAGPWSPQQTVFVPASSSHDWPTVATSADNTGEKVHELWFADTAGPLPKAFVPDDSWYTVLPSETMAVTAFVPAGKVNTFNSVKLAVKYSTGSNYNGKGSVQWSVGGGPLQATSIVPTAGQANASASFDLFALGVKTREQLKTLVVAFTNGSGSGAHREMAFDQVLVDVGAAP